MTQALAAKKENKSSPSKTRAKKENLSKANRSAQTNPTSNMFQRKSSCACGGGCPRCYEGIYLNKKLYIQTKLRINEAGDKYEQEADRIAEEVIQRINETSYQPLQYGAGHGDYNEKLSMKPMEQLVSSSSFLSPKAREIYVTPRLETSIRQQQGRGHAMREPVREAMEKTFGMNFNGVKIHIGAEANELNNLLQARAFTIGQDIFFGQGEHNFNSLRTNKLLAHELTHTIQQKRSVNHSIQREQRSRGGGGGIGTLSPFLRSDLSREMERELRALGITRIRIVPGVEGLDSFCDRYRDESVVRRLLANIQSFIARGGAGSFGQATRFVDSWNRGDDDLDRYPTPLHYMQRMNLLARSSMGPSYNWERAVEYMDNNCSIRFAGRDVIVHPRALYFVAAAQVNLNRDAYPQMTPQERSLGHFIPVGSFRTNLLEMRRIAAVLAGFQSRTFTPPPRGRRSVIPNSYQVYNYMIQRIQMMSRVLIAQGQNQDYGPWRHYEHRQQDLRMFFEAHQTAVNGLSTLTSDTDIQTRAEDLMNLLAPIGSTRRYYGAGATDPHGTLHGLGMAIDMFTAASGRGSRRLLERSPNSSWPREFWRIMPYLMERIRQLEAPRDSYRPIRERMEELLLWRANPENALRLYRFDPDLALLLSRMMDSPEFIAAIEEIENSRTATPTTDPALINNYRRILFALRNSYGRRVRDRRLILSRIRQRLREVTETETARQLITDIAGRVHQDNILLRMTPAEVFAHVRETERLLRELDQELQRIPESAIRPNRPWATQEVRTNRLGPNQPDSSRDNVVLGARPTMERLNQWIEDNLTALTPAFQVSRRRSYSSRTEWRPLYRWMRQMSDPEAAPYDQPTILVNAMNRASGYTGPPAGSTRPTRRPFMSHHWDVADEAVLSSGTAYRDAIIREIRTWYPTTPPADVDPTQFRNDGLDRMREILRIMIQSPEGRGRVFGPGTGGSAATAGTRDWPDSYLADAIRTVFGTSISALLPAGSRLENTATDPRVRSLVDTLMENGLYATAEALLNPRAP